MPVRQRKMAEKARQTNNCRRGCVCVCGRGGSQGPGPRVLSSSGGGVPEPREVLVHPCSLLDQLGIPSFIHSDVRLLLPPLSTEKAPAPGIAGWRRHIWPLWPLTAKGERAREGNRQPLLHRKLLGCEPPGGALSQAGLGHKSSLRRGP